MTFVSSLAVLCFILTTGCYARYDRRQTRRLSFTDIVHTGPNSTTCLAVQNAVLELQPVYFSSYVLYNTIVSGRQAIMEDMAQLCRVAAS